MKSWYRLGQKVTLRDGRVFTGKPTTHEDGRPARKPVRKPVHGITYTVDDMSVGASGKVCFRFAEDNFDEPTRWWRARWFRPVYPSVIEDLLKITVPVDAVLIERITEDA